MDDYMIVTPDGAWIYWESRASKGSPATHIVNVTQDAEHTLCRRTCDGWMMRTLDLINEQQVTNWVTNGNLCKACSRTFNRHGRTVGDVRRARAAWAGRDAGGSNE